MSNVSLSLESRLLTLKSLNDRNKWGSFQKLRKECSYQNFHIRSLYFLLCLSGFIGLFWLEKIVLENPYDVSKQVKFEVPENIMAEIRKIQGDSYLMFLCGMGFVFIAVSFVCWKSKTKRDYRLATKKVYEIILSIMW